jgi:hypothetical protein
VVTLALAALVGAAVVSGHASAGVANAAAAEYEYGPAFVVSPVARLSADRRSVTITGTVRCAQWDWITLYPFGVMQVVGRIPRTALTQQSWIECPTAGLTPWSLTAELVGTLKFAPGPAVVTGFYVWWHASGGEEGGQVNTVVRLAPTK